VRRVADEALLDSYQEERWPVGRFVLRFSDRASSIAISDSRFVRLIRTQIAPRLVARLLRFRRGRTFGFRTISQLAINYRNSPSVQEGEPALHRGPKAGDRPPDARITRDSQPGWLQEALAAQTCHLLLCGPVEAWDGQHCRGLRMLRRPRCSAPIDPPRRGRRPPRRRRASIRPARRRTGGTATSATGAAAPICAASSATSPAGSLALAAGPTVRLTSPRMVTGETASCQGLALLSGTSTARGHKTDTSEATRATPRDAFPVAQKRWISRRNCAARDRTCTRGTCPNLHGKEGVDGSSPSEGFAPTESLRNARGP
jgi:hypothetical protein